MQDLLDGTVRTTYGSHVRKGMHGAGLGTYGDVLASSLTPDIKHLKEGEVNLGTSIMAVAFEGGVVLGADSRTSMGPYVANRVTDKLTYLTNRIYCCRSGSSADTQAIADIALAQLEFAELSEGRPPSTHEAAALVEDIVYEYKHALSAGLIVAGWDNEHGGSVYHVLLGGGLFKTPWAISGSGSAFIYGFCDEHYRPGWGRDDTVAFVRSALTHAMARDASSGGVIRMVVITRDGVERVFVPGNEIPQLE